MTALTSGIHFKSYVEMITRARTDGGGPRARAPSGLVRVGEGRERGARRFCQFSKQSWQMPLRAARPRIAKRVYGSMPPLVKCGRPGRPEAPAGRSAGPRAALRLTSRGQGGGGSESSLLWGPEDNDGADDAPAPAGAADATAAAATCMPCVFSGASPPARPPRPAPPTGAPPPKPWRELAARTAGRAANREAPPNKLLLSGLPARSGPCAPPAARGAAAAAAADSACIVFATKRQPARRMRREALS